MADDLDARLLAAHAANDRRALVALYLEAARTIGDEAERAFLLTHAWVFALEAGDPAAAELETRLRDMGRA